MGDPRLLQRSEAVQAFGTPELAGLLEDMRDTMKSMGGIGIAAPQIGVSQRVVIFGFERSERYPEAPPVPETVLINPELTPLSEELEEGWEACLSVPGLRGFVPRYPALRYRGYDETGALIDRTVEGFHARVVQHEVDHVEGILYPMRIRDLRNFGFADVIAPGAVVDD
jgi:peptide deformylase